MDRFLGEEKWLDISEQNVFDMRKKKGKEYKFTFPRPDGNRINCNSLRAFVVMSLAHIVEECARQNQGAVKKFISDTKEDIG